MSQKKIAIIVSSIFLLSAFSTNLAAANSLATDVNSSGNDTADWTVMYYLCCENHVSYEADTIVNNLAKIGSSDNLNIIVLKDGDQNGDSVLYYIEEDNARNLNEEFGWPDEIDMGDPNTITSFIDLVKNNYSAKHYAFLILSDMGSGWQGICHDTRAPDKGIPLISIPTFANALKNVTDDGEDKIDVIVLMPCVMGMFEVAYEISPYVKYLVASEEHMLEELDKGPEYVLQYVQSTWNLRNNTDMTPEEFASSIINYYNPCDFPMWVFYSYMVLVKKGEYSRFIQLLSDFLTRRINKLRNPNLHIVSLHTTLSAIKLSNIQAAAEAIDNLSSILSTLNNEHDEDVIQAIAKARNNVREYGKFYAKNRKTAIYYMNIPMEKSAFDSFVDIYDIANLINGSTENQVVKDACTQVMRKLKDTVIANSAMPDDESHGLSIYFPENGELYNKYLWADEISSPYEDLKFSRDTLWDDFLREYLDA
jgi:hypothetical protein